MIPGGACFGIGPGGLRGSAFWRGSPLSVGRNGQRSGIHLVHEVPKHGRAVGWPVGGVASGRTSREHRFGVAGVLLTLLPTCQVSLPPFQKQHFFENLSVPARKLTINVKKMTKKIQRIWYCVSLVAFCRTPPPWGLGKSQSLQKKLTTQ